MLSHIDHVVLTVSDIEISMNFYCRVLLMEKVREFVHILENNGVVVDMIVTDNPGKIIYSDEFQIFANPYRKF